MRPDRHPASEWAVVVGALVLAVPFVLSGYISDDELSFNALADGMRIAHGEVMFRDFFNFGAPVPSWIAAACYTLFGATAIPPRIVQELGLVLAAWQAHRLGRWLGAGPWAAVLPAWILLACGHAMVAGYNHHWLVVPFVFAALLSGLGALEGERARDWLPVGVWTGVAALTLQTDGFVLALALAGFCAVWPWLAGRPPRAALAPLAHFAAGVAAPFAVTVAFLAAQGALGAAYDQLVRWPFQHYSPGGSINDIKYLTDFARAVGPMADVRLGRVVWYAHLVHYLATALVPLLVAVTLGAWGLGVLAARARGRVLAGLEPRYALVGLAALGMVVLATRGRADVEHMAMYGLYAWIAGAAAVAVAAARVREPWGGVAALAPLALAGYLASGLVWHWGFMAEYHGAWSWRGPDALAAEDPTIRYLRAHARAGDRLVAGPNGGYYYFYGLPPAVRLNLILDEAAKYYTPAEIADFRHEVATCGARFIVVDATHEPFLSDAFGPVPPGYRPVFGAPSMRYRDSRVTVYERAAASERVNSSSARS